MDTSVLDPNKLNLDLNFGPIWIRIQGYSINFGETNYKNSLGGKISLKISLKIYLYENNGTGRNF